MDRNDAVEQPPLAAGAFLSLGVCGFHVGHKTVAVFQKSSRFFQEFVGHFAESLALSKHSIRAFDDLAVLVGHPPFSVAPSENPSLSLKGGLRSWPDPVNPFAKACTNH